MPDGPLNCAFIPRSHLRSIVDSKSSITSHRCDAPGYRHPRSPERRNETTVEDADGRNARRRDQTVSGAAQLIREDLAVDEFQRLQCRRFVGPGSHDLTAIGTAESAGEPVGTEAPLTFLGGRLAILAVVNFPFTGHGADGVDELLGGKAASEAAEDKLAGGVRLLVHNGAW